MATASFALLLVVSVTAISTSQEAMFSNTYVTEIIIPFDMPMTDLSIAANNQLSRNDFKTSSFSGQNVTVNNLVYKSTYNGTQRTIDPPGQSSRHVVTGDALDMLITYQATLHPKLPTRKTFNGSTTLKIYLNYTKEIDTASGVTEFQNLVTFVDPSSFNMTYSGSPSAAEKKILDGINNGSSAGKNIWHLLRDEEFSKQLLLEYFIENLQQQKLSPTYDSTYEYNFEGINATFDMRTVKVEDVEHGISNSLKGSIKGFSSDFTMSSKGISMPRDNEFHTLYSVGFMRNFLDYNIEQNSQWKNFKADRSKYRQGFTFGFRLIDLQYILQKIDEKYSQNYLDDLSINCSPKQVQSIGIDQVNDKASARLKWACKGFLLSQQPYPIVLDFDIGLTYIIQLFCSKGYLSVLIEKTYFDRFDFRPVEGFKIKDAKLAQFYAKQMISSIFGYTVGTNFRVKANSSKLALKENEGLWVG